MDRQAMFLQLVQTGVLLWNGPRGQGLSAAIRIMAVAQQIPVAALPPDLTEAAFEYLNWQYPNPAWTYPRPAWVPAEVE